MGKSDKRLAGIVTIELWRKMLQVGRSLDINKGGLYDSREGAINIWASPEDKPAEWENIEITRGALEYPRSIVGTITWEPIKQMVDDKWEENAKIFIEGCPYARWENEKREARVGKVVMDGEWSWITNKTFDLMMLALKEIPTPEGIYCRLCDKYIKIVLMNEFIEHLVSVHGIDVKSISLGDPITIHTDGGTIEV